MRGVVETSAALTSDAGLEARVDHVLGRRLHTQLSRPIAVALSGGGDSLALVLIADAWALAHGRPLVILTVDHGLSAGSDAWSTTCEATAARLGRPFRRLSWDGVKPTTGLPAAARAARHRLLADAAREAGARVLLMGHTADDLAESRAMRQTGSTTPDAREWGPSPAWPQGRGLFLLRPLLATRRMALRDWLTTRGESWIDDPANTDLHYARSRARATGPTEFDPKYPLTTETAALAIHHAGIITLPRSALREANEAEAVRLVGLCAVCAGGGSRRPATVRIVSARERLRGFDRVSLTLAGARLEADGDLVRIFREAGEAARGGLATTRCKPGAPVVWDGRFEITSRVAGDVRHLAGLAGQLSREQAATLRALPPAARGGLPAIVGEDGQVTCLALNGDGVSLIPERLRAAAGLIDREPA